MADQTYRRLGHSTLDVSAVGLGCMWLSGVYGPADDAESIALIHRAIDLGVNHVDSSDMYGWGHNEELLGRALKGRRERVILATKFGQVQNPGGPNKVDGRAEYVIQACETSLKRLGVDVIDLYYQHRVDPKVPIEETVGGMKRLVEQGKVRYLGLCEAAPETIRRAHRVHPISALQSEYSLLYREHGRGDAADPARARHLVRRLLPARAQPADGADPEASGHPRGRPAPRPPALPGPEPRAEHRAGGPRGVAGREKGCTPAQLVLAWLLAQGRDIVPIPGTKRLDRLQENLGALKVQLSADDVARVSAALPVGAAAGPRYPEAQLKGVNI